MTAEALLLRLEKVRRTGAGRWIARCPVHHDKSPSLSIRELDDGRVLLHCFAGCSVHDVVAAVGLEMDTLFPDRPTGKKPERRPFSAMDALRALAFEGTLVLLAAKDTSTGKVLSAGDIERLAIVVGRINAALEAVA